ncbi:MAG: sulfite exporter TauE/SafE family protein [Promethearchaeota archaeon]
MLPCEDKAIFGFHAFGIAKNNTEALKLVGIYGLGLLTINNLFGLLFSIVGGFISLNEAVDQFIEYLSPIATTVMGVILLYRLIKMGKYDEHYAIPETFKLKKKKRLIYLLGIFTGLPPCPFEFAIYFEAIKAASGYFITGIIYVFWFSVGTVIGLFILAMLLRSLRTLNLMKDKQRDTMQKIISLLLIIFGILNLFLAINGISLYPEPPPINAA